MGSPLTVLIVDDIFVNRLLIKEIVRRLPSHVLEAQNGREAIDQLQGHPVDVVLMDIEMPVMNGIETTRYIRQSLPAPQCSIPIIAITAHNPATFFEDYKDVGFDRLMTKPYSSKKLLALINEVCPGC